MRKNIMDINLLQIFLTFLPRMAKSHFPKVESITLSGTLAARMHLSNLGFGNHILMFMTMTQSCFMGKEAHNEPSIF